MSRSPETRSAHTHQVELIDEFDLLLGRSIRQFQQLEQVIEFRLLQLTAASSRPSGDVAELLRIAIAELSFSTKSRLLSTQLLQQLPARAEYKFCQKSPKTKASLDREIERSISTIKLLGKLEEMRNRFVHSHWLVLGQPPERTDLIPVMRFKTRATPKKFPHELEEFSAEHFRKFLAEVKTVEDELSQATGRLLGLLKYDGCKTGRAKVS